MRSFFVMLLIVCFSPFSKAANETADWKTVMVEGKPLSITQNAFNTYKAQLQKVSFALSSCTDKTETKIKHPLTERQSQFIQSPVGGVCRFIWNRDMRWRYTCTLDASDKTRLNNAFQRWIQDQHGLGDFSEDLKTLLFDQKICSAERI